MKYERKDDNDDEGWWKRKLFKIALNLHICTIWMLFLTWMYYDSLMNSIEHSITCKKKGRRDCVPFGWPCHFCITAHLIVVSRRKCLTSSKRFFFFWLWWWNSCPVVTPSFCRKAKTLNNRKVLALHIDDRYESTKINANGAGKRRRKW